MQLGASMAKLYEEKTDKGDGVMSAGAESLFQTYALAVFDNPFSTASAKLARGKAKTAEVAADFLGSALIPSIITEAGRHISGWRGMGKVKQKEKAIDYVIERFPFLRDSLEEKEDKNSPFYKAMKKFNKVRAKNN